MATAGPGVRKSVRDAFPWGGMVPGLNGVAGEHVARVRNLPSVCELDDISAAWRGPVWLILSSLLPPIQAVEYVRGPSGESHR